MIDSQTSATLPSDSASAEEPVAHLSPNQKAWQRFRRNRLAMLSSVILAAVVLLIVAWPIILKLASINGHNGAAFSKRYQPETISDEQFQDRKSVV